MVTWYVAFLAAFDRPLFEQHREAIVAPWREDLATLNRELARVDGAHVLEYALDGGMSTSLPRSPHEPRPSQPEGDQAPSSGGP